jgi:hypothetical protein
MAARVMHGTLVADTVTTVTLDHNYNRVEVLNRDGAAEIYFTVDAGAPTVEGDGCYSLPAAIGGLEKKSPGGRATVVKMISSGTPTYSVTGIG